MKKFAAAAVTFGVLLILSYGSVRPVAIQAGDRCFRCRRPIAEIAMAAELMDGNRFASKFRTSGCMARYLADHAEETGMTFVTDHATGKWIRPERAQFVPVVLDRNTGESDYRAFSNKADADEAAAEQHTAPIDWTTVMANARRVS